MLAVISLILIFSQDNLKRETTDVCFQKHCFEAKLAKTKAEKRKGLKGRENLKENKAMLFVYSQERKLSFWMKDTLIPLDIIWLNKNKEIIDIKHQAQPCKSEICPVFEAEGKSQYVLELKGGMAEEIGLKEGRKLKFKD